VQSSNQNVTTNKPTSNFLDAECPSCRPANSVKALKGKVLQIIKKEEQTLIQTVV